jgi:hypothetical protein
MSTRIKLHSKSGMQSPLHSANRGMRCITTFRSTTERIYDGGSIQVDLHIACRAAKGLECVLSIWFTQCGRVWFTLAMPCHADAHAHAMPRPCVSSQGHSTADSRRPCCGLEKNDMVRAWHGRGMAIVNQTRPHCVNQMGKTHYKPLAKRHGKGTAWARQAMCESVLRL